MRWLKRREENGKRTPEQRTGFGQNLKKLAVASKSMLSRFLPEQVAIKS